MTKPTHAPQPIIRQAHYKLRHLMTHPPSDAAWPGVRLVKLSAGLKAVYKQIALEQVTAYKAALESLPPGTLEQIDAEPDLMMRDIDPAALSHTVQLSLKESTYKRRQLCILIRDLQGDWSHVDDLYDCSPDWPPVDLADPDPALQLRDKVLSLLDDDDLEDLHTFADKFVEQGGAGLTQAHTKKSGVLRAC